MLKQLWLCGAVMGLVMGCRSVDVEQVKEGRELEGNWSFVYYEATDRDDQSMPGPPFDSLRFTEGHLVYARQVFHASPFLCPYELQGDEFRIRVPVSGRGTVLVKCQAYLADGQGLLVLRDRGTGAVFLRTEALVTDASQLAGDWLANVPGKKGEEHVTVSHGGGIFFRGRGYRGEYRLWHSEAGMMLSTFLMIPGWGVRTVVWRLEELRGGALRLRPYGPTGLLGKGMTWRRVQGLKHQ